MSFVYSISILVTLKQKIDEIYQSDKNVENDHSVLNVI